MHVPGTSNLAARLSVQRRSTSRRVEAEPEIVSQIWARFGVAVIDLFASRENTHCRLFFSILRDNPPLGVDAMAHQWPQGLLPAVGAATRRDLLTQAQGTLLHPFPQGLRLRAWPLRGPSFYHGVAPVCGQYTGGARAPSTRAAYSYRWGVFQSWCRAKEHDALSCTAPVILRFLQEALEKGKSPSTLRGMVAAIKAARVGPHKLSQNCCDLISQFIRGALRIAPGRQRSNIPPWELDVVLSALRHDHLNPWSQLSLSGSLLRQLSFLLLCQQSGLESSMLSLYTLIAVGYCQENTGMVLRTNPAFHPKVLSGRHGGVTIQLQPFCPPQQGGPDSGDALLCPVRAVQLYVRRTEVHRKTDQLFVCFQSKHLGQACDKNKAIPLDCGDNPAFIYLVGLATPQVSAGTLHSESCYSWALWRGASLAEIVKRPLGQAPPLLQDFTV
ncbi:hypothetical protein WMY93_020384 [Mugilogobius chulae]|uniref:Uncharacterized protein n=1 Tax=Mugilogobius chulae TaxID=88201 RepID=A0AAW0NTR1_9GOBI